MQYFHLTFHLNKALDIEMALEFLQSKKIAGFDFKKEIIDMHPDLKKMISFPVGQKKQNITQYINNYYLKNKKQIIKAKKDFQKNWDRVEKDFFVASDKIFGNLKWAQGEYKSYISILPIGPRFLNSKTFQTCYTWRKNIIGQVIHELLHFQFFNLIKNISGTKELNENQIWHLSEIFNDIIQSENSFVAIQNYSPKVSYPDHKKFILKYRRIWRKNKKARYFIKRAISEIKKDFNEMFLKEYFNKIQNKILALLNRYGKAPLNILAQDTCSEVSRLVGGWIKKSDSLARIFVLKGEKINNTDRSHDILAIFIDKKVAILDPTVWQIFPEAKDIFFGDFNNINEATLQIKKKYGGDWKLNEEIKKDINNKAQQELEKIIGEIVKENLAEYKKMKLSKKDRPNQLSNNINP